MKQSEKKLKDSFVVKKNTKLSDRFLSFSIKNVIHIAQLYEKNQWGVDGEVLDIKNPWSILHKPLSIYATS